jgi:hypothetical protein
MVLNIAIFLTWQIGCFLKEIPRAKWYTCYIILISRRSHDFFLREGIKDNMKWITELKMNEQK